MFRAAVSAKMRVKNRRRERQGSHVMVPPRTPQIRPPAPPSPVPQRLKQHGKLGTHKKSRKVPPPPIHSPPQHVLNKNLKTDATKWSSLEAISRMHANTPACLNEAPMPRKTPTHTYDDEINNGNKNFTCYTMDFTQKYISINSDYRS